MTIAAFDLDRSVRRLDAWRSTPLSQPAQDGSHKEWIHFCIRLPPPALGHLLVNLNVTESLLPSGITRTPRLLVLAQTDRWRGHVESFADADVRGCAGEVDVRFGDTSVCWNGSAFVLKLRTPEISADLAMTPLIPPTGTSSVSFGPYHRMQWVAVPRLSTRGEVRIGARHWRLFDEPAYHDHNWGHFRWGTDLAWEWGFVHPLDPRDPWTITFVRVSDGKRHQTLSQGVLLWKHGAHVRTFQNHEIQFELTGAHRGDRPLTIPQVMTLLVSGSSTGVPEQLRVRCRALNDELALVFTTESKARIAVPSDDDPFDYVLLNETSGRARVHGRIDGAALAFDGTAVVEFVRG